MQMEKVKRVTPKEASGVDRVTNRREVEGLLPHHQNVKGEIAEDAREVHQGMPQERR